MDIDVKEYLLEKNQIGSTKYRLSSVAFHHGEQCSFGHFTSIFSYYLYIVQDLLCYF